MRRVLFLLLALLLALATATGCGPAPTPGDAALADDDDDSSPGDDDDSTPPGDDDDDSTPPGDDDDATPPGDDDDSTPPGEDDLACPATEPLGPELLPRCSNETADCILACDPEDWECPDECVAADTTPADSTWGIDCTSCGLQQYLACARTEGCEAEVDAYACCQEECGWDESCISSRCAAEVDAIYTCGFSAAQSCWDAYATATDGCTPLR